MNNFFPNKTAFITLVACCLVVIISLGVRQTFGLFYFDFSTDLDITISQFGFAMGLQLFLWGAFNPLFGVITDKYGGSIAIFIGFLFYLAGVLLFYLGFNTGVNFIKILEHRLDTVLFRMRFANTFEEIRQFITHKHILVNGKVIKNKSYILKSNDLIQVSDNLKIRSLVKKNLDRSNFWPLPPKHLLINYRTLEIIFLYNYDSNLLPVFNHYLHLDSVIANIKKY